MQTYKAYLEPICNYLHEHGATKILLDFLLFMKDDIRCGLAYIKLFHEDNDVANQMAYLQNAKGL